MSYHLKAEGVNDMGKMYESIMQGLQEALDYEKGKLKNVRIHKVTILPLKEFTPSEIKDIRIKSNMTQQTFASCIGVTKKAVEAWEGGRSCPDGAARRTLGLMQSNPNYAKDVGLFI